MIEVGYKKSFLKDLKKLKYSNEYTLIKDFCFDSLESLDSIDSVLGIKKIKGFDFYYRKRVGNYRIGFKYIDNKLTFLRVLSRKDIYRKFP